MSSTPSSMFTTLREPIRVMMVMRRGGHSSFVGAATPAYWYATMRHTWASAMPAKGLRGWGLLGRGGGG